MYDETRRSSTWRTGIAAFTGGLRADRGTAMSKGLCLCARFLSCLQTRDEAVMYNNPGGVKLDLPLETLGWFYNEEARDLDIKANTRSKEKKKPIRITLKPRKK